MSTTKKPNQLIRESSPYLLQHAYNPVNWMPWNEASLQLAKIEDKPILVSIGYSSCHWCHVMEHECFEKEEIADIMNKNFICIKVDREERPDVDQVYMEAVQLMGVSGGWPLNVFLTSDQKPFYGGTYFPSNSWQQLLLQIAEAYQQHRDHLEGSADKFVDALNTSDIKKYRLNDSLNDFTTQNLINIYQKLAENFDQKRGGMRGAPKFPMPSYWQFVLKYYAVTKDQAALDQVVLTLTEMAHGGIYDQIGGGFSRYSVDAKWLVPHFEKMLYDNGQLLSLYADGYSITKSTVFKHVIYQTIDFLEREMMDPEGGFYSALDADSEGVEGKYYVWDAFEFSNVLYKLYEDDEKVSLLTRFYQIMEDGNWEERKNILHKKTSAIEFAKESGIDPNEFDQMIKESNHYLLTYRNQRVRPGLDDKILAGWNGLALKGLVDCYLVCEEPKFIELAIKNASFIKKYLYKNGMLFRNYKAGGAVQISGFLEDYALVIQGFTELYQAVFDEQWLEMANQLTDYVLDNFYDEGEKLFFYTDQSSEKLIARKKELFDNVIPASNSVMANNLYKLGHILGHQHYGDIAKDMLKQVGKLILTDSQYLSNWAGLYAFMVKPTAEIAIVGNEAEFFRKALEKTYCPNKVVSGTKDSSNLPLLQNRVAVNDRTTIYVCFNNTCKLPVDNVEEAFKLMQDG